MRLDASAIVGPLRVDGDDRVRARWRRASRDSSPRSAGTTTVARAAALTRLRHDGDQDGSHVLSAIFRIASAARRLAPGPPSLRRTSARPSRIRAARCGSVKHRDRFAGDGLRRERVLDQLRHDPLARDQVHHREGVELDQTAGRCGTRAATGDRRRPSACREARSARSRCPTPSATTIGRREHRIGVALDDRERRRSRRAGSNRRSSRCGARAMTNCAAGTRWRIRSAAAMRVGRMRRTSLGRLPGRMRDRRRVRIETRAAAGTRRARRCRVDQIDQRMPDELDRHAGVAIDRFLERKNHEHAIGDRADGLQPAGTPGPDLRADVVDDRDAELLDARARRTLKPK